MIIGAGVGPDRSWWQWARSSHRDYGTTVTSRVRVTDTTMSHGESLTDHDLRIFHVQERMQTGWGQLDSLGRALVIYQGSPRDSKSPLHA
eukprot:758456-Hanusia_phi.AAC.4